MNKGMLSVIPAKEHHKLQIKVQSAVSLQILAMNHCKVTERKPVELKRQDLPLLREIRTVAEIRTVSCH